MGDNATRFWESSDGWGNGGMWKSRVCCLRAGQRVECVLISLATCVTLIFVSLNPFNVLLSEAEDACFTVSS